MKRLLPLLLALVLAISAIVPAYATGDGNFDGGYCQHKRQQQGQKPFHVHFSLS